MSIYLPRETSRKKKREMKDRYVFLTLQRVIHIENFIRYVDKMPMREYLSNILRFWDRKLGLGNISVKIFRKI